jgi:hypothetical protein
MISSQRINKQRRARNDILSAASRLLKENKRPSMEEVAGEFLRMSMKEIVVNLENDNIKLRTNQ